MNKTKPILPHRILALTILLLWLCMGFSSLSVNAAPPKVLRVGWYDYPGFYTMDQNGYRSGYAYDYLQEIARYGGWTYEYINGTADDCLQMLNEGKIDLIGSVMYSPQRAKTMNFSALSIGKNFTILTARLNDARYQIGEYQNFKNIRIGALSGDLRQKDLVSFAKEQGFSYNLIQYDTIPLMEQALRNKNVDAILTTDMRVAGKNERLIAQFAPADFFIVTQKENEDVMHAIDSAMEQISFSNKNFQASLSQKYFSASKVGSIVLTSEEQAYLRAHPVFQVILPALRKPMCYLEQGEYKGILIDIMTELTSQVGVECKFSSTKTQTQGIDLLQADQAVMLANTYNDYGWAEINHMFLTRPYIRLDYVSVAQMGTDLTRSDLHVAAVTGYRFSQDYILRQFPADQITWYDDEAACIDAVRRKEQEICFVSSYVANTHLQEYPYRNLYSSIINYSHGLSVAVRAGESTLLSIMDKAISNIGDSKLNRIVMENTMLQNRDFSFREQVSRNPIPFFLIFTAFCIIILALISMLAISHFNRRKNKELYRAKLAAERDSLTGLYNRLSFELLINDSLEKRHTSKTSAFAMMDIDNFKKINDTSGHSYGDKVLVSFAQSLRVLFEADDILLCRMGGDEFAIFWGSSPSRDVLHAKLQEAQKQLKHGIKDCIPIPCSIGAVVDTDCVCSFSELYETADTALYQAKRNGKGTVCMRDPIQTAHH